VRCALAALVLLAACSDDVDLTGVYRVDTNVASSPCGADQPVMTPPAFLKFQKEAFITEEYFSMLTCTDAAGMDCTGGGLFGDSFPEPIDGGWRGVVYSAIGTAPSCFLAYTEQTAKLSGVKLVVDISSYGEQVSDEALCTTDEAEKRGMKMPCTDHERLDATRQ
jgi:hypothetical protein